MLPCQGGKCITFLNDCHKIFLLSTIAHLPCTSWSKIMPLTLLCHLNPRLSSLLLSFYIPCQNVSPTGCRFLDKKYNPRLHTNQLILTTHVSLHRYFLFVCTIYMCLSFSVESGVSGLTFKYCSSPSAITNPIAYM